MKYDQYTNVPHVAEALRQYHELLGILGKKLIASIRDSKFERIDAELLSRHPWTDVRYLVISRDGLLLAEVGKGSLRQHIRKLLNVTGERVLEVFDRIPTYDAEYIVAIHEEAEEEGFVLAPKHMVIHRPPTGQNMIATVAGLADKAKAIIATGDNN